MRKIPIWIPILMSGLLIRIYLLIRMPIWLDEKLTIKLLHHSLSQIINGNLDYTHPFGYYTFLKIWSFISTNTVWLRLSTIMFFLFNFFLLYQIGNKFYNKKFSQILIFLYTFSGYFLIFDWQFRMYTGLTTFILISLYLFQSKLTSKNILALFITSLAGLFFDYGFVFYFLPLIIWAWIRTFKEGEENILTKAFTISISLLVYAIIWGPNFLSNFREGLGGIEWVKDFTGFSFFTPYFLGFHSNILFSFVFFGLMVYGVFLNFFRKSFILSKILFFASSISLVSSAIISWLFTPFLHVRSLQIIGITVIIFYAHGLLHFFKYRKILAFIFIIFFIINSLIITIQLPIYPDKFLITFQ